MSANNRVSALGDHSLNSTSSYSAWTEDFRDLCKGLMLEAGFTASIMGAALRPVPNVHGSPDPKAARAIERRLAKASAALQAAAAESAAAWQQYYTTYVPDSAKKKNARKAPTFKVNA